jgi:hypothetical protein
VGIVAVAVSALGSLLPGWTDLGMWHWVVLVGALVSFAALVPQHDVSVRGRDVHLVIGVDGFAGEVRIQ